MQRLFDSREHAAARLAGSIAHRIEGESILPAPDSFGRIELFRTLEAVALPADVSGLLVRDGAGRPLAWRGRSYGLPPGPPSEVTSGISSSAVYRVLYSEVPVRRDGRVVGSVLAWSPFDLNYPLHNRYLRSGDFEAQVAARLGLKSISVSAAAEGAPEAGPDPRRREGTLENLAGRPMARISVEAFPADVYVARIEYTGRGARAVIVTLLLLLLTVLAARAALAPDASPPRLAVFLVVVTAARIGIYLVGFPRLLFSGPAFDPAQFSYPVEAFGTSLGLLHSPVDVVLSGLAGLAAAAVTIRFAARRLAGSGEPAPHPLGAAIAGALSVGLAAGLTHLWLGLVHALPFYSTVDFLSEQTVLPELPATLLLLGLFLATVTLFLAVAPLWALAVRLAAGPRRRLRRALGPAGAVLFFAALLLGGGLTPVVAGIGAVTLALAAMLLGAYGSISPGLRIAGLAALVTVFTYLPFQFAVWREIRADVEDEAAEFFQPSEENPLRHRLDSDLSDVAANPRLVAALTEAPERVRPQLAFRVWAEGPLARRPRGADLTIYDRTRKEVISRFDIDMPPLDWLPEPRRGVAAEQQLVVERPGVGGGIRQKFLVGSAPVHSRDGDFIGQVIVRVPVERPVLGPTTRPEILSSYEEEPAAGPDRELYYTEYEGDRLVSTTNPDYPRLNRAPADVVKAIYRDRQASVWKREEVGGEYWINLYRPRFTDGRITGMTSVGFRAKEMRDLFLAFFKLLLVNGLAGLVVLGIATIAGIRRFQWKFQHKLLLSYLIVSAVPVVVLAELNRNLARETVEGQMRESLRESVRLVKGELRDRGILSGLTLALRKGSPKADISGVVSDETLKEIGYRLGQEVNLFLEGGDGEFGAKLVASSEPGIFATELFSDRLSGRAYLETVLLGREFYTTRESVGDYSFLVGYSPLPDDSGRALGAISLPMIYGQDAVDRELARRNTLIIALYLLILLIVFFLGVVLARRISSPIEQLAEATRRLSAGDLDYRIPDRPRDEFGYLVDSFNHMTADLAESRATIVKAEKDAAWREMAKQIAHEIKNPLTPMRLSAQHILRAYKDRHEEFEQILTRGVDTIIRQTETLRRIAGEFSAFARMPLKQLALVDPAALAREVAGLYAGTGGVEVVEEIEDVAPVLSDRDELRRVLVNLTTNAVQAMEGREGVLTLRVHEVETRYGGEPRRLVTISVSDTGVGIPAGDLARLFEPNFSTKTGGTGLGLAISKAVVESLGGEITVASEVGRGTTVSVRLPPGERPESAPGS